MNLKKEKWNSCSTNGIDKDLELVSNLQSTNSPPTPKEAFLLKQKSLKMKAFCFFLLNNIAWFLLLMGLDDKAQPRPPLPLHPNHEIVKLPAQVFSKNPSAGEKIRVLLKHQTNGYQTSAYLRLVESDALAESGLRATLEVPNKELEQLNAKASFWLIYPYYKTKPQLKNRQRRLNEIVF